ncbi:MAG TPA: hypothetical protein VK742_20500 [Candidatus Sulfotelmatobacter sp.]|jgi:hypothetical protein|nr:hypothetical protein [Candidatus Sulfotelmatobacter sp.]
MTYETLQYVDATGATQEVAIQNLTPQGTISLEWNPRSLEASEFVITLPQAPETPLVIPFKSRCIIRGCRASANGANNSFSAGTILFQGRRTDVDASSRGGEVSTVIKVSDLFWDLKKLTYKMGWNEPTGGTITAPVYGIAYFADIVMFQPDQQGQLQADGTHAAYAPAPFAGELITTWQQLMAIVYYAMNFGGAGAEAVQVQMSNVAEFTPSYRNTDTARSIKCLEAIVKCLQPHPQVRSFIDHTTTPPTLHFRDIPHSTPVNLPYKSTDPTGRTQSHEATNIKPLPDLKPDRVNINYKINGSLNGSPVVSFATDTYPAAGGPFLQTEDYSVDISGLSQHITSKNFVSHAFDPTSLDLWRLKVASLKEISEHGQIPNDGAAGALTFINTAPYDAVTNPKGIQVFDADLNPVDYEATFIYWTPHSIYAWFTLSGGVPVQARKATVKAFFNYDKVNLVTGDVETITEQQHSFHVLLTNAPTAEYFMEQTENDGESAPPNLAQNIFTELAVLQWKLNHKIWQAGPDQNTPPAFVFPGNNIVNLVGGDPAWTTMNAVPENVTIRLQRVLIAGVWTLLAHQTIECGPMNHLEPSYYVQLWNMFANRKIRPINSDQRLTGLPAGGNTDLSATDAADNSQPAQPVYGSQIVCAPDAQNTGVTGGAQITFQLNAPTGQIPVFQQPTGGATTRTTGVIAPVYSGLGPPSGTAVPPATLPTLPANTYYREFDQYYDMTGVTASKAPVVWLCITAGTSTSAVWSNFNQC